MINTDNSSSLFAASEACPALRIIIIEDNLDTLETMKDLLVLFGHEVVAADDGESGLSAIRLGRPDVVICDIQLPGAIDGYAVARAVRKIPSLASTFLIALTGYGQKRDIELALESGFDLHLLKPVMPEDLGAKLQAIQMRLHPQFMVQ